MRATVNDGNRETCQAPRCKRAPECIYLGRALCERHLAEAMDAADLAWCAAHPGYRVANGLIVSEPPAPDGKSS